VRTPPPISEARRYPITVAIALQAIVVSAVCWLREGQVDRFTTDVRAFHGEPWRLVSSALPHGDVLHLLFNIAWTWASPNDPRYQGGELHLAPE